MSDQVEFQPPAPGATKTWPLPLWAELGLLALILALAGFLRLAALDSSPGWYSDEGTLVDIARHLSEGRVQYMALEQSTLLAARLPLFVSLLAGLFRWFGADILVLRAFTGALGVLAVALLYAFTRRAVYPRQPALPLLAALMLAIFPDAVLFSRLGFSYNLLAVLGLAGAWALWVYLDGGRPLWAGLAGLAFGLGAISDLMMISMMPAAAGALLLSRRKGWGWGLLFMALPFLAYCALMLLFARQAFLFDFAYTFTRLGKISFLLQAPILGMNFAMILFNSAWWALGALGIFLLQPPRLRRLAMAMLFVSLAALGRTAWLAGLQYYYLIPLLPWVMLGLAGLIHRAAPYLSGELQGAFLAALEQVGWQARPGAAAWLKRQTVFLAASAGLFLILVSPFLISTLLTALRQESSGTPLCALFELVMVAPQDGRQAAAFLNQAAGREDLVIASPALAWALEAQTADFQQTLAANHQPSAHFPEDVDAGRFAYPLSLARASYVAVDPVWVNWAAPEMTGVAEMLAQVESWPLAFEAGEVRVYRNPALAIRPEKPAE